MSTVTEASAPFPDADRSPATRPLTGQLRLGYSETYPTRGELVQMPEVKVDLPDELAEQVRKRDLPVSAICQRALRAEVSHLLTIEQAAGIIVQVGEPAVDMGFRGRWLVEPHPDRTQAGLEEGAYWGVALTKRGRIAVYRAHVNKEQPASLSDYDTLDNAIADDLPEGIIAMAKKALGEADVVWRDI